MVTDLTSTMHRNVALVTDHGKLVMDAVRVGHRNKTFRQILRSGHLTIVVGETGRNTNTFDSFANNVSPITLDGEADINSRVTVSYAGADATLIVRDESTDISITSDDFWNSGEPATVTVEAPNLDLNTKTDDHVTIDSELIPTIVVGDPITIADFDILGGG